MVGALLNDNRGLARVDKMTTDRIKKGWISNSGIIKSVVGLFTLARTDFADIELFRDELAFRLALELERVPSEETLRQRLDLIAKLNSRQTLLDYAMRDLLRKVESFGTVKIGKHKSVLIFRIHQFPAFFYFYQSRLPVLCLCRKQRQQATATNQYEPFFHHNNDFNLQSIKEGFEAVNYGSLPRSPENVRAGTKFPNSRNHHGATH